MGVGAGVPSGELSCIWPGLVIFNPFPVEVNSKNK